MNQHKQYDPNGEKNTLDRDIQERIKELKSVDPTFGRKYADRVSENYMPPTYRFVGPAE